MFRTARTALSTTLWAFWLGAASTLPASATQEMASAAPLASPASPGARPLHKFLSVDDKSGVSLAYQWLDHRAGGDGARGRAGARGRPIISRTMAIWATAMYDAWAAYDDKAVGTRLGGSLRRPAGRAHAREQGEGDRLRLVSRAAVRLRIRR